MSCTVIDIRPLRIPCRCACDYGVQLVLTFHEGILSGSLLTSSNLKGREISHEDALGNTFAVLKLPFDVGPLGYKVGGISTVNQNGGTSEKFHVLTEAQAKHTQAQIDTFLGELPEFKDGDTYEGSILQRAAFVRKLERDTEDKIKRGRVIETG